MNDVTETELTSEAMGMITTARCEGSISDKDLAWCRERESHLKRCWLESREREREEQVWSYYVNHPELQLDPKFIAASQLPPGR